MRRAQAQLGVLSARVAGHVGQRLLGDAVDDQLLLVSELGKMLIELLADPDARPLREPLAQDGQRADQAQVVERLGPQFQGDAPHVLQAGAHRLLDVLDVAAQRVVEQAADAGEAEQHRSQLLADLVMQLQCDPQALGLLGREHTPGRLAALGLQAGEHLVEGEGQLAGLRGGGGARHAGAGSCEVDAAGQRGERLQRADDPAQHDQVDQRHQRERGHEDERLVGGKGGELARGQDNQGHRHRGHQH